ncbi:MAG: protein kinase [Polyangiaceae bacterium]
MGVVVAARHRELEQRVAVKFLLPEIAKRTDAAERFRREARAAVKIRSEHVARVLDVGTADDGVPYMVMEYLEGHDLGHELVLRGQLPVAEAVGYVLQACEAVAEAHASGIVHRDLKPANLFLAHRADGSRLVKVLDFGISKSVTGGSSADLSLTATSALIGSPLYMSPEQMHSAKTVDSRTDLWALGAILFQLLANRPPYVAESIPQLCNALLNELPPPLSQFRNDVPEALQVVVAKALAKDRAERWQSVGEMALALVPFAPDARVHAERASRVSATLTSHASLAGAVPNPDVAVAAISTASESLANQATEVSGSKAAAERTLDSWGKTGGPGASPSKKTKLLTLAGVGVLAAVALVVWGVTHTSASANPSASPAVAAPPPPVAPPTSEAHAPNVEPAALPMPAEAALTGTAVVDPAPSVAPAPQKRPSRVQVHAPERSKPTPKPPVPSDFGGRR